MRRRLVKSVFHFTVAACLFSATTVMQGCATAGNSIALSPPQQGATNLSGSQEPTLAPTANIAPQVISPEELYQQCSPSVVQVLLPDSDGKYEFTGSGFVVAGNRVITAAHVVGIGRSVRVVDSAGHDLPGAKVSAVFDASKNAGGREGPDLAIIQLDPTDIHPLPLADSSTVKIGQRVFVIGSPEGLTNTLSDGLVSNITRTGAVETSTPSLQITAPISHGSSGGPVLLESGQVVGVANAFLREGQNINFAVPVDSICDVLDAMNSLDGLKTLQNRADAGDVHAIYELGLMYELGCGVELDWKQARSWYRKGADMGDANSMAAVGDLTYRTYTTDGKPDGADAIVWFRKAAVAGNSFAEDKMGQIYLFGWGVPKDSSMAVVWFRRAAIHGNSQALIDLGFCYQRGKGVPVDSDESHKLFQMAADEGNTWGQEALDAEAQPMTAADWDAVMRVLKAAAATNPSPDSP